MKQKPFENIDDEYEHVENTVLAISRLLHEYDRLVKVAVEIEKFGGEIND